MKKGFLSFILVILLISGLALPVWADTYYGGSDWYTAFRDPGQSKLDSNFTPGDLDDAVRHLQPGDRVIFNIDVRNDYDGYTDWWMENSVIKSLEDASANSQTHGGGYTYLLTYTDRTGTEFVLFSSETVGGEIISPAGEGLHAATDALEDMFYVDTLAKGQKGKVTLEVALDGETQGNDYQDTLAELKVLFAVELNETGTPPPGLDEMGRNFTIKRKSDGSYELVNYSSRNSSTNSSTNSSGNNSNVIRLSDSEIVRTGDETNLTPYYIAMAVSGFLILILAFGSMRQGRKEKKGAR